MFVCLWSMFSSKNCLIEGDYGCLDNCPRRKLSLVQLLPEWLPPRQLPPMIIAPRENCTPDNCPEDICHQVNCPPDDCPWDDCPRIIVAFRTICCLHSCLLDKWYRGTPPPEENSPKDKLHLRYFFPKNQKS